MNRQRREFLHTLAGGAASLTLSRAAFAQASPTTAKLTDKVTLITGAGNNIVALSGDEGTLLVDCGDAAHAQDVLKLIPNVKRLFNTHWHLESSGANEVMARAGAKIVSHLNTRLWMTQEIDHDWDKKVFPPRVKDALPVETFTTTGNTTFGGEAIEYGLLPMAHTDGDIYLFFKQANVLVVGDTVQPDRLPYLDWFSGGWIGGMQDAHRTVLRLANDDTKIVPGSGPLTTKAAVQANLDILTKIREAMLGMIKQGKGAADMIQADLLKNSKDQLTGDPAVFLFNAYRGMWGHIRENPGSGIV